MFASDLSFLWLHHVWNFVKLIKIQATHRSFSSPDSSISKDNKIKEKYHQCDAFRGSSALKCVRHATSYNPLLSLCMGFSKHQFAINKMISPLAWKRAIFKLVTNSIYSPIHALHSEWNAPFHIHNIPKSFSLILSREINWLWKLRGQIHSITMYVHSKIMP